ncbi:MAG TPA: Mur ligase domain-containing protein, partial [Bacillota bacterium]|nr:Mur ligase domain-containing protein [Bacillota bacterium]
MKLQQLLSLIPYYTCDTDIVLADMDIASVQVDSRNVGKGDVFVCIEGYTVDGHDYVPAAVNQGAAVIVAEKQIETNVPVIVVP